MEKKYCIIKSNDNDTVKSLCEQYNSNVDFLYCLTKHKQNLIDLTNIFNRTTNIEIQQSIINKTIDLLFDYTNIILKLEEQNEGMFYTIHIIRYQNINKVNDQLESI